MRCDVCNIDSRSNENSHSSYSTWITREVPHEDLHSVNSEVSFCEDCFRSKLVPWLQEIGVNVSMDSSEIVIGKRVLEDEEIRRCGLRIQE